MINPGLEIVIYQPGLGCLHSANYIFIDSYHQPRCGPCYFRWGVIQELPGRTSVKKLSEAGTPDLFSELLTHLEIQMGLKPPKAGESLKSFRKRRSNFSKAAPIFPFSSALWLLMGYQPPLAVPLVEFCKGFSEIDIANKFDWSLFNVQERLGKASRTALKTLRI